LLAIDPRQIKIYNQICEKLLILPNPVPEGKFYPDMKNAAIFSGGKLKTYDLGSYFSPTIVNDYFNGYLQANA